MSIVSLTRLRPRALLFSALLGVSAMSAHVSAQATAVWQLAGVEQFYANDPVSSGIYRSQGIATDGNQWFFSWQYGLERADANFTSLQRNSAFVPPGGISPGIPTSLLSLGLNHIGDI